MVGRVDSGASGELLSIPVGYDRAQVFVVVAALRSDGVRVEMLQMDEQGLAPGIAALQQHRLLIRAEDLDLVRERLELAGLL